MKAVICTKYGPPEVLQIKEVEKPVPKDNEVLIKIYATTVTSGDSRIRGFNVPIMFKPLMWIAVGFRGPRNPILGVDIAGEVEATGKDVTLFKAGDQIFGSAYDSRSGTYAEYSSIAEDAVMAIKPANMDYGEAAAISFGAHTALHFLRKADIRSGHKVLIYGASGSVGTYAVQLAKHLGAEVTGVCSTSNMDMVRSLGADNVIDYTKEDFSKNGEIYDVIFDTVGMSPFSGSVKSLKKNGYYLRAVHLDPVSILRGLFVNITSKKKVIGDVAGETVEDLGYLRELADAGKLKPIIDRTYKLGDIVEAHRYVDQGHKKGNVVIAVAHDDNN